MNYYLIDKSILENKKNISFEDIQQGIEKNQNIEDFADFRVLITKGKKVLIETEKNLVLNEKITLFTGETIKTIKTFCDFLKLATPSSTLDEIKNKIIFNNHWEKNEDLGIIAKNTEGIRIMHKDSSYCLEGKSRSGHSYYSSSIKDFLNTESSKITDDLNKGSREFNSLRNTQGDTWDLEVKQLKEQLYILPTEYKEGRILLEYTIPRLNSRIDVVLLIHGVIFLIEYKVGSEHFYAEDKEQINRYFKEIIGYHEFHNSYPIVKILIATKARSAYLNLNDEIILSNGNNLSVIISTQLNSRRQSNEFTENLEWGEKWEKGQYQPSPSILDAAAHLYNNYKVDDIENHEADNLKNSTKYINDLIKAVRESGNRKVICFVTGVPGAGKTLVGLNVVSEQQSIGEHAVFLSGNGPLVAVLRESLALERHTREDMTSGEKLTKTNCREMVEPFIQIVHNYRDTMLDKAEILDMEMYLKEGEKPEIEHIAVFDEAQRAWTREKLKDFLKTHGRKEMSDDFPFSEPGFLIWSLDQHNDWAVIVCLVGGGQEINEGEAGINEWLKALKEHFPNWEVHIPKATADNFYESQGIENTHIIKDLHLSTGQRYIRAQNISSFVKYLLDRNVEQARNEYHKIRKEHFPLFVTRDLQKAKKWLQKKVVDSNNSKCGLLVSSKGERIKALGYNIQTVQDGPDWYVNWFLKDLPDVRSSSFMEVIGNEFIVQGLELDYIGLVWESDFRYSEKNWIQKQWRGGVWNNINNADELQRQLNAYRVLLTRARLGMVIIVPEGYKESDSPIIDDTRKTEFYDCTYNYLKSIGLEELPDIE